MWLREQGVVVDPTPELCFGVVAAAGRRLENRSERGWVVEQIGGMLSESRLSDLISRLFGVRDAWA